MKFTVILASLAFAGSLAFADDAMDAHKDTVDTSKNPITGTKTTTKKHKAKKKDAAGNEAESTVKTTTKEKTDGTVEKKTEVDAGSTQH